MISLIIPFVNEVESLPILIHRLIKVSEKLAEPYEIILINDGSNDGSDIKIQPLVKQYKQLILLHHRKRLGKGRALTTGYAISKGDKIVFMDADLQDDPDELPKFISKLNEGYDFVNGWRKIRLDKANKTVPSAIFNKYLLSILFHSKYHDINCGYKAMKRQVLKEIVLYGDNYRFLPIMADQFGFRTTEIVITHFPRKYGVSKYGAIRLLFGLLDTLTTYFIYKFSEKPLHFFGPIGLLSFLIGFGITFYLVFERIFFGVLLYRRPSLLIGILLIIVGIQVVMTGVIGELIVFLNNKNK
ncbi:MAG: glycosyltransferase family 2 protein [bacterium]|nr:glycosyltransferase family 2 protein [bacterium]